MHQRVTLLVVVLTLPVTHGCTYALGPYGLIDGQEYRRDQVSRLSRGMNEQQVRSLLGEPRERRATAHGVTWQYHAVYQQRACEVALFGIIAVQHRPRERFETTVVFGQHGLDSARHVERMPGGTTSTELVTSLPR